MKRKTAACVAALFTAGAFVGCGSVDVNGTPNPSADANAAIDAAHDSSTARDGAGDASVSPGGERDASTKDGSSEPTDAGGDGGIRCTAETANLDCPARPCPLALSGCVSGICQYAPIAICPARAFTGAFVSGFDTTVDGGTTLIGNIGQFRAGQGRVCSAGICVTGGIVP